MRRDDVERGAFGFGSRVTAVVAIAVLALFVSIHASAATQTYYITGHVGSGSFSTVPENTPFTGWYSFDDAATDTNGAADIGTYATGAFHVDFGPAIGMITFDQSPMTNVKNDQAGFFPGFYTDTFSISAGAGARDTPGFTNAFASVPSMVFSQGVVGTPGALSDDTLTGVPQVFGSPWDVDGQTISLPVSATGGGCPAFTSTCYLNLTIESVAQAYTLTVTTDGTGTGTVTSEPAGIDCPGVCGALLGGTIVLTAVPNQGSKFTGWTGCDSVDGDQCTVTLASAATVNATFDLIPPIPAVSGLGLVVVGFLIAIAGMVAVRLHT